MDPELKLKLTHFAEFAFGSKFQTLKRSKKMTQNYLKELWKRSNFRIYAAVALLQTLHCHFNSNYFPFFLSILFKEQANSKYDMQNAAWVLVISFILPHILNIYNLKLVKTHGSYQVLTVMFMLKVVSGILLFGLVNSGVDGGASESALTARATDHGNTNQITKDSHQSISTNLVSRVEEVYRVLLMIYILFNRVLTEGVCKLLDLPLADLCDEDRITRGRNTSAALSGTLNLFTKPGQSMAALAGHFFLGTGGKNSIIDADRVLEIMYGAPIFLGVIQCLFWSQYNLHKVYSL